MVINGRPRSSAAESLTAAFGERSSGEKASLRRSPWRWDSG